MATLKLNGKDYDMDKLSKQANDMIRSLRITESKIAQLQQDLAIANTAKNAYTKAILDEIEKSDKQTLINKKTKK